VQTAQPFPIALSAPIVHTMLTKPPLYALFVAASVSLVLVLIQINVLTASIRNISINKTRVSTFPVLLESISILSKAV